VRSLVVRADIVDGYACRRPPSVSKESAEEWLRESAVAPVSNGISRDRETTYGIWEDIITHMTWDHERPVFHAATGQIA
jgi:hypothetical protein